MRCVSYTKNNTEIAPGALSVEEQNEAIKAFARKNNLIIEKKYSDRRAKGDSLEQFQKMKDDAISRAFDCLFIHSVNSIGKNVFLMFDLFRDFFVPAGIQFAIVEENFVSIGKTSEELKVYLQKRYKQCKVDFQQASIRFLAKNRHYEKFGYVYSDDGDLLVDEKAAPIVQCLFEKAANGMLPVRLAEEMNQLEVLSPPDYLKQRMGKTNAIEPKMEWKYGQVVSILRNELYTGVWRSKFAGEEEVFSCPAIVSKEQYCKVQAVLDSRRNGAKRAGFSECIFSRSITDKETGQPMVARIPEPVTGAELLIASKYRTTHDIPFRTIQVKTLTAMTKTEIAAEKVVAVNVSKILQSAQGKAYKESLCENIHAEQKGIVEEMLLLSEQYLPLQIAMSEGTIELCNGQKRMVLLNEAMKSLDKEYTDLEQRLTDTEKAFSMQNPWLKLYSSYDGRTVLTREQIKKFTGGILCVEFSTVEIVIKEQRWKDFFPQEWLEVE